LAPDGTEAVWENGVENGAAVGVQKSETERLNASRRRMQSQLEHLDITYQRILNPHIYKVSISEKLKDLKLKFIQDRIS